jgi:hypothetical protein
VCRAFYCQVWLRHGRLLVGIMMHIHLVWMVGARDGLDFNLLNKTIRHCSGLLRAVMELEVSKKQDDLPC